MVISKLNKVQLKTLRTIANSDKPVVSATTTAEKLHMHFNIGKRVVLRSKENIKFNLNDIAFVKKLLLTENKLDVA